MIVTNGGSFKTEPTTATPMRVKVWAISRNALTLVSIMRPTEAGGPPLRLDTRIDDSGKATNIGQNYALLPGDHIIVASDNRSSLERFIDKQFRK